MSPIPFILYAFALIYRFGYGSLAPVTPYLIADRFGGQVLRAAYGLCTFFSAGVGGALGPIIGGFIFDKTGSYRPGWIISMICLLMISLLILALKPNPDRLGIRTSKCSFCGYSDLFLSVFTRRGGRRVGKWGDVPIPYFYTNNFILFE